MNAAREILNSSGRRVTGANGSEGSPLSPVAGGGSDCWPTFAESKSFDELVIGFDDFCFRRAGLCFDFATWYFCHLVFVNQLVILQS